MDSSSPYKSWGKIRRLAPPSVCALPGKLVRKISDIQASHYDILHNTQNTLVLYGQAAEQLKKGLVDPVYSRRDEYTGSKGLSWLYRMQPLSIEDGQWDDAESAAIQKRFAGQLAGNAKGSAASLRIINVGWPSNASPASKTSLFQKINDFENRSTISHVYQDP